MGNDIIVLTIEELQELLELGTWCRGYRGYIITEEFNNKEKRVYNVEDLHIETENEYVIFYDYNDTLIGTVLSIQLKKSILNIRHYMKDNLMMSEDIVFSTGHVYIDAIAA